MEKNRYIDLISKHLSGAITPQEQEQLRQWIDQSKENHDLFEELKRVWELSANYESDFTPDLEAAKKRFKARIASSETKAIPLWNVLLRVAAVIVIFAVGGYFVYNLTIGNTKSGADNLTAVTLNATSDCRLPDGSHVWLNKNSKLSYSKDFSERKVFLEGEAFFEIVKNKQKPFTIYSGDSKTVVLGTSFNMVAAKDSVQICVVTGSVQLSDKNNQTKATLTPGEKGTFKAKEKLVDVSKNSDPNFLSWKTQIVTFTNVPFAKVLETLQKHYDKKIILKQSDLNQCKITSTFDHQAFTDVMQELKILLNINYTIENDRVIINSGGC